MGPMNNFTKEFFNYESSKICSELKKSPTFAMSLGAKELFHTNFLAFLFESNHEELRQVQNNLKMLFFGEVFEDRVFVFREKVHMDLILLRVFSGKLSDHTKTIAVAVEAKLKSIPTQNQLDKYSDKFTKGILIDLPDSDDLFFAGIKNVKKIKLTIGKEGNAEIELKVEQEESSRLKTLKDKISGVGKTFILTPKTGDLFKGTWEQVTWDKVAEAMHQSTDITLVHQVVRQYGKDLASLMCQLDLVDKLNQAFINGELTLGELKNLLLDEKFRNLRIHDLISKYSFWRLSSEIGRKLINPEKYNLEVEANFFRSDPIINFFIKIKDEKADSIGRIGVQIQENQYRHFIQYLQKDNQGMKWIESHKQWFDGLGDKKDNKGRFRFGENFEYTRKFCASWKFDYLMRELSESFDGFKS